MAFRINLFSNDDDEKKDPFSNLIKTVRNKAQNFGSTFAKSFQNYNRQRTAQQQQAQRNSREFAQNVYSRAQKTAPVRFAQNVGRTIGDFSTGIRIDDRKPFEAPKSSNIFNNIRRNVIRWDPKTGLKSNVADALVKAPGQALYGTAPFVFNRGRTQLNRIKSPVTGQGLGDVIADVYRPETPDQELQAKVAQGTGRFARDAVIFKSLGNLGALDALSQTQLATGMAAKQAGRFLPNVLKAINALPGFKENMAKFAVGMGSRSVLNQVLDEKYQGKNLAENATEITFDAALTGLTLLGFEAGLGSFAGSSFGDNINFIKKLKLPLRSSLDKQYMENVANQINQKIHSQWNPAQPINNPAFIKHVEAVNATLKQVLGEGNIIGAYEFVNKMPSAPASFINSVGAGQGIAPAAGAFTQSVGSNFVPLRNNLTAGVSRISLNPPINRPAGPAISEGTVPAQLEQGAIRGLNPEPGLAGTQIQPFVINQGPGVAETGPNTQINLPSGDLLPDLNIPGIAPEIQPAAKLALTSNNFEDFISQIAQQGGPDALSGYVYQNGDTFFGQARERTPEGLIRDIPNTVSVRSTDGKTLQLPLQNALQKAYDEIQTIEIPDDLRAQIEERKTQTGIAPEDVVETLPESQTAREVITQEFQKAIEDTGQEMVDRGEVGATAPTAELNGKPVPAGVKGLLNESELDYLSGGKGSLNEDGMLNRSAEFDSVAEVYESVGQDVANNNKYINAFNQFTNKIVDSGMYRQAIRALGEEGIANTPRQAKKALAENYAAYLREEYTPTAAEQTLFNSVDQKMASILQKETTANGLIQSSPDVKEAITGKKTLSGNEVLDDLSEGFKLSRDARNAIDIPGLGNEFKTKILDRFAAIEATDAETYMNIRLLAGGGYARVERMLLDGIGKPLIDAKGNLEELNQLLALQRMNELVGQRGLTRRYDQQEIEDGLFALKEKLGSEKFDQLVASADEIRAFKSNILRMAQKAGLISEESLNNMEEANQMHIAFETLKQIVKDNSDGISPIPGSSFNVARQDVFKNIGDSDDFIAAPLETELKKIARTIELADKNSVLKDFVIRNKGTEVAVPLREAENVKERITLASEINELKKVQRRAERIVQTRAKTVNRISKEMESLQAEADSILDEPLQPVKAKESFRRTQTLFSTGNPAYSKVTKIPTTEQTVRQLVEKPERELTALVKKLQTRDKQLRPVLQEIKDLNELYWETKDEIVENKIRLGEIKDISTVPEGYDTINVLQDGIKEEWAVPKLVASAIKNLDNPSMGVLGRIASIPNNILRATAIEYNPAFLVANPVRDVQDVAVTLGTKEGAKAVGQFVKGYGQGIASAFKMDDLYKEWQLSGGGSATLYSNEMVSKPETTVKSVSRKAEPKLRWNKPLSNMKQVLDVGSRLTEEQSRIAAFTTARPREDILTNKAEYEPFAQTSLENRQAAFDSRNSSIDFARGGTWTKKAGQIIFLLNPGVQGSEKFFRLMKENPINFTKWLMITTGLPTIYAYLNNRGKEDFNDLSEFEQDTNHVFIFGDRTPEQKAAKAAINAAKMPIGFMGKPFAKALTEFLKFVDGKDPKRLDQLAIDILNDTLPLPLPVGENGARELFSAITPTAIKGALENQFNTNMFTGFDIESQYVNKIPRENVPEYLRTGYDTSVTLQAATRLLHEIGIDISPAKIENLVNTQLGGAGREVLKITDALLGDPIKNAGKIPVLGRFYGPQGGQEARDERTVKTEKEKEAGYAKSESRKQPLIGGPLGSLFGSGDEAAAASPEEMVAQNGLPEKTEDLGVLYKDALSTLDNYNKSKTRIQYKDYEYEGDRAEDLAELDTKKTQADAMLNAIKTQRPDDVFKIELDTYGKGSTQGVENRADWAVKQLESAKSEDDMQEMINQMWESGVLTSTANGTAKYIEEIYGVDLKYTGDDPATKKKAGTGTGKKKKIPTIKTRYKIPSRPVGELNYVPAKINSSLFRIPVRPSSSKILKSIPTAEELLKNAPTGKIKLSPEIAPLPQTLSGIGRL